MRRLFGTRSAAAWILALLAVSAVRAQPRFTIDEVGWVYRDARFLLDVEAALRRTTRRMTPRPPERIRSPADTLDGWIKRQAFDFEPPPEPVAKAVHAAVSWKIVSPHERVRFAKTFDDAKWAFLGNNHFTTLDTTRTVEIRARMQSRFGPPTQTVSELNLAEPLSRGEWLQFEYWFVVNDSIPMIVADVNGPFDRGVIVAADHRYRDVLYELRRSFLGSMMQNEPFAPYVDHYFNYVSGSWYRTGWDGEAFFTERIRRPNPARGRPELSDR